MATMTRVTAANLGAAFAGAAAGQQWGVLATPVNGDLIPIGSGQGTLIAFRTTGTASTIVIDSVLTTQYGTDQDLTVTLAATDFQFIFIDSDGYNRFDQGPNNPANAGLLKISTYSSTVGLTVYGVTIP